MFVKCYNKKCFHEWDYRGDNKEFICCPICRFKRKLGKCKATYLQKSDIPTDRPSDIPTNDDEIETINHDEEIPIRFHKSISKDFGKIINRPQTEFIEEEFIEEELEEIIIENHPAKKLCNVHNLPTRYSDFDKKWICKECIEESMVLNKPYKNQTNHLGTITEIKSDVKVNQIPYAKR